ncbi:60S ribosomal protein L7a-1 [Senna tora]|uniref:60S ribosomal protein L7a n=1 Tax=Senna tora TaxID=362788 RepID=A0A834SES5_9FABA|nr:60S ribosomal protein L7a-1 [Senna tora]
MLLKYRPEDKAEKKERLLKRAQAEAEGKTVEAKKPIVVKYGLNHVTYLIEQIVHKKTASVLCLTTVKNEDKLEFSKILEAIKANFNDKYDEYRKKWGGGIMGSKSQARTKAKERLLAKEAAQRMS